MKLPSVDGILEKRPRVGRWLWRLVGLCLQVSAIGLTLLAMAGSGETKWGFFLNGVAMAGGFILWKEAEKVGQPKKAKGYTIDDADIEADERVAAAVAVLNDYLERREANNPR